MKFKKYLSMALTVTVLTSSILASVPSMNVFGQEVSEGLPFVNREIASELLNTGSNNRNLLTKTDSLLSDVNLFRPDVNEKSKFDIEEKISADEMVRVLIILEDESVLDESRVDVPEFIKEWYENKLESKQNTIVKKIEKSVLKGDKLDVHYNYTWLLNGIAAEIPYGLVDDIERLAGVSDVLLQPVYEVIETEEADNEIYTNSDGVMIGREDTWANGLFGEGMKIAIIDTGLDDAHPSFADDPVMTEQSATMDSIAEVLPSLNAFSRYENLTADMVWRSNKIAFGFNYVDHNLIINHDNDSQGDHGTHVAGIAAANKVEGVEAVGVAPEAQLYIMKVFGAEGGAYTEDILAACEDALLLGADVINMSLGSPAGFNTDGEEIDKIYQKVGLTKSVLAVAAGNSTTQGLSNLWGTDKNLTSNPDNGIVSSPATYFNATSVASIDNLFEYLFYMEAGDKKLQFIEGQSSKSNAPMSTLAGSEYEFAFVDNFGQEFSDFTDAGVEGKIAVVQRGVTAFTSKAENAQNAGAIGLIVFNNTTGSISMDFSNSSTTIPVASITQEDGEYLISLIEEGKNKILVSDKRAAFVSPTGGYVSDFSSWGTTTDLKIEPEVAAPGGNIYSTRNDGTYGLMSGTSMASPNFAGTAALVSQYIQKTYPDMEEAKIHELVNALLLSTSVPLFNAQGIEFSPRAQGSGLVNVYNAVTTGAYLSVDDSDTPKVSVGDDVDKTGEYSFTYHVSNISNKELYYALHTTVQSEDVLFDEATGMNFMAEAPISLEALTSEASSAMKDVYDINGDGVIDTADARIIYLAIEAESVPADDTFRYQVDNEEAIDVQDAQSFLDLLVGKEVENADLSAQMLCVPAGETVDVTVSVSLMDSAKEFMDTYYENGIYVEGFSYLDALNTNGVDLSLPYLGFYGDWTQAPIFDNGFYYEDEEESQASEYYNVLFSYAGNTDWYPGVNLYVEEEFNPLYTSMGSLQQGFMDNICAGYFSFMRNVEDLTISAVDSNTGEVYYTYTDYHAKKAYYYATYGMNLPYIFNPGTNGEYWFTDAEGNPLPTGTEVDFIVSATLAYDAHESNNAFDTWTTHITVDNEAPVIDEEAAFITEKDGHQYLTLTFSDNVQVAVMSFVDETGKVILGQEAIEHVGVGETATQTFDITGFGNRFFVIPGDYVGNESMYAFTAQNNDPTVSEGLYGYRVFDDRQLDTSSSNDYELYGWVNYPTKSDENGCISLETLSSEYFLDTEIVAAVYADGYVVAADYDGKLYSITPGWWFRRNLICDLKMKVSEMAFDEATGVIYAYGDGRLVTINVNSGEIMETYDRYGIQGMAVKDGVLYGLEGDFLTGAVTLNTYSFEDGFVNATTVAYFNLSTFEDNSLVYSKKDECFYWAYFNVPFQGMPESALVKITLDDAGATSEVIGVNLEMSWVVGLIYIEDQNFAFDKEAEIEKLTLSTESAKVLLGDSTEVTVYPTPWYVAAEHLTWSSEDESIATVEDGEITGVAEGTTTITVTADNGKTASVEVTVIDPKVNLAGFVIATNGMNFSHQWASFSTEDFVGEALAETISSSFYAAALAGDGNIYGYDGNGNFYKVNGSDYSAEKIGSVKDYYVSDMAFDYSTGKMYALANKADGSSHITEVDLLSGQMDEFMDFSSVANEVGVALACDTKGILYVISSTCLYAYDPLTYALEKIGQTGYVANADGVQSMTYNPNDGNLYWAMVSSSYIAEIMYVDMATGAAIALGGFDLGAQITGLMAIPEDGTTMPEAPYVSVIDAGPADGIYDRQLVVGGSVALNVVVRPYNATNRVIDWEFEDPSVAEIRNGYVYGKKVGSTALTGTLVDGDDTFTIEMNITVAPSADDIRGFVYKNLSEELEEFWMSSGDNNTAEMNAIKKAAYKVYGGEYYDGKIYTYGVDANYSSCFVVYDAKDYSVSNVVYDNTIPDVYDMAFDYSTGTMYVAAGIKNVTGISKLYACDYTTGKLYLIANLEAPIVNMACSTDGTLYGYDEDGLFYVIDKETGAVEMIGVSGHPITPYSSMAYDHNTGNLYWANWYRDEVALRYQSALYLVDPETGFAYNLGQFGGDGAEITAMHIVPQNVDTDKEYEVSGILLSETNKILATGESFTIDAATAPLGTNGELSYSVEDENVASVDESGVVTGIGTGTTKVVVSYGDIERYVYVTVCGDDEYIYTIMDGNIQWAPVLKPGTLTGNMTYESDLWGIEHVTYFNGMFYGVDAWTNELYSFDEEEKNDLGTITFSDADAYDDVAIKDMKLNTFNDKLYIMADCFSYDSWMSDYNIYELDMDTLVATNVGIITWDAGNPVEFSFVAEDEILIYDIHADYLIRQSLGATDAFSTDANIVMDLQVGAHVSANEEAAIGMVYSRKYKKVFLLLQNNYPYAENQGLHLYMFDPESEDLIMIGNYVALDAMFSDLFFME